MICLTQEVIVMNVERLFEIIDLDFYTGVPDSQLKALCNYLMNRYGIDEKHHVIAVNEGNCVALAAGYHLATGKVPVVYMQNSGEGNVINPLASLLNDQVYAIPVLFVVGWRGEPGVHDEPQHIYQGKVTLKLLEDMDVETFAIDKNTTEEEVIDAMAYFQTIFSKGKSAAFVVKKGSLSYDKKVMYKNSHTMLREDIVRHIVKYSQEDLIVSTTGKASRELFEIREALNMQHKYDFLTVGSMGHSSSIALGVAINKPEKKVWCIDGDGAVLMHMGAMALIGNISPDNMVHIVINNMSHETVGGMPTASEKLNIVGIAKSCGYKYAVSVDNEEMLDKELIKAKGFKGLSLIEVKCAIGARDDLGRPTTTAIENKEAFMEFISK